jgi:DNA-binding GntR family transcriptional regulator
MMRFDKTLQIVKLLMKYKKPLTVKQLSMAVECSPLQARRALKRLEQNKIAVKLPEKNGNTSFYELVGL